MYFNSPWGLDAASVPIGFSTRFFFLSSQNGLLNQSTYYLLEKRHLLPDPAVLAWCWAHCPYWDNVYVP